MSDAEARSDEREAATGDPEAARRVVAGLVRRGAPPAELMHWLPGYPAEREEGGRERPAGLPFDRGYIGWSPGGDYMPGPLREGGREHGWQQGIEHATWAEARPLFAESDPDMNLVVDFYFAVRHDTEPCATCQRSGLSTEARDHRDQVTRTRHPQLEMDWYREARESKGEAWLHCAACEGHGERRTGPDRLSLKVWLLHPRKGASRGVEIRCVLPEELEDVRACLRRSWDRLNTIWSWVRP